MLYLPLITWFLRFLWTLFLDHQHLLYRWSSCRYLLLVQRMLPSSTRFDNFFSSVANLSLKFWLSLFLAPSHFSFVYCIHTMQELNFDPKTELHVLETLPENIDIGTYTLSFEVLLVIILAIFFFCSAHFHTSKLLVPLILFVTFSYWHLKW